MESNKPTGPDLNWEDELEYIMANTGRRVIRGKISKGRKPYTAKQAKFTTWEQLKPLIDASKTQGKITRANILDSDWDYLHKRVCPKPYRVSFESERKLALKKVNAGVAGTMTAREVRIVYDCKKADARRNAKRTMLLGPPTWVNTQLLRAKERMVEE